MPWGPFCSYGEQGYSWLWCVQASPGGGFSRCRAQAPGCAGFSGRGSQPLEHRLSRCGAGLVVPGTWNLPGPGIEHVSPALAGRFFAKPPGKAQHVYLILIVTFAFSHRMNELLEGGSLVSGPCVLRSLSLRTYLSTSTPGAALLRCSTQYLMQGDKVAKGRHFLCELAGEASFQGDLAAQLLPEGFCLALTCSSEAVLTP